MNNKNYIGINDDKLHHILGVARRCYELALERNLGEYFAMKMFTIGWMHDVGYEFSVKHEEHPKVSELMFEMIGGRYNHAIASHGKVDLDFSDAELAILNEADLTVDHKGNKCTVEERLNGIIERYGEDSKTYKNAKLLAEQLGLIESSLIRFESTILLDDNVEVNSHGVNKKIKANILSDAEMRKIGFTDHCKDRWYFCREIDLKDRKYRDIDISFSITIPKDGSDIRIDVLDEAFCQPYDYQSMIVHARSRRMQPNKVCVETFNQVEHWMKYLSDNGIITGHVYGEYI